MLFTILVTLVKTLNPEEGGENIPKVLKKVIRLGFNPILIRILFSAIPFVDFLTLANNNLDETFELTELIINLMKSKLDSFTYSGDCLNDVTCKWLNSVNGLERFKTVEELSLNQLYGLLTYLLDEVKDDSKKIYVTTLSVTMFNDNKSYIPAPVNLLQYSEFRRHILEPIILLCLEQELPSSSNSSFGESNRMLTRSQSLSPEKKKFLSHNQTIDLVEISNSSSATPNNSPNKGSRSPFKPVLTSSPKKIKMNTG